MKNTHTRCPLKRRLEDSERKQEAKENELAKKLDDSGCRVLERDHVRGTDAAVVSR